MTPRLICTNCHSELDYKRNYPVNEIIRDAIVCQNCMCTFPVIWNVPYLGKIQEEDILSLIEITAAMKDFDLNDIQPLKVHSIVEGIQKYCEFGNSEQLKKELKFETIPEWLNNRFNEQMQFNYLTSGIDLRDKNVLDVGAGTGYDSIKFSLKGAKVYCIEFNPILAAVGKATSPESEWSGGSSKFLHYQNESFDVVAINAALHHFFDIPTSISESLRVLKIGGFLITSSDPFSPDSYNENDEAGEFNSHPDVLRGINESKIHFSEIAKILSIYKTSLDIRIFTDICYPDFLDPKEWSFEEGLNYLLNHHGSVSVLIKKLSKTDIMHSSVEPSILSISDFSEKMKTNPQKAFEMLADLIPAKFLNQGLISPNHPKFMLLNGWQKLIPGNNARKAYKRSRLFYSLDYLNYNYLSVSIMFPYHPNPDSPELLIKINGNETYQKRFVRGIWVELKINLKEIRLNSRRSFFIEFQMITTKSLFEENCFICKDLIFTNEEVSKSEKEALATADFGFESLYYSNQLNKKEISILVSPEFYSLYSFLVDIRNLFEKINIICLEDQKFVYEWSKYINIIDCYPNPVKNKEFFDQWKINKKVDIILVKDLQETNLFQNIFPAENTDKIFILDKEGRAVQFIHPQPEIEKKELEIPTPFVLHPKRSFLSRVFRFFTRSIKNFSPR